MSGRRLDYRLYVASKAKHRPMWRHMRDTCGYRIISSWIDVDDAAIGGSLTPQEYAKLWRLMVAEVQSATLLIAYFKEGETHKGTLVEIGVALATGIPVLTLDAPTDHSWRHHPLVRDLGHDNDPWQTMFARMIRAYPVVDGIAAKAGS